MLTDTEESIRLLKSINFVDSALFGLSIDIFKITLLVTVIQTAGLQEFGFDDEGACADDLAFDFSRIGFLNLNVRKGEFGPPYLATGELAALDFASFRSFDIRRAGLSGRTDRDGEYRDSVPIHELVVETGYGSIEFSFCDVRVRRFKPEQLDL